MTPDRLGPTGARPAPAATGAGPAAPQPTLPTPGSAQPRLRVSLHPTPCSARPGGAQGAGSKEMEPNREDKVAAGLQRAGARAGRPGQQGGRGNRKGCCEGRGWGLEARGQQEAEGQDCTHCLQPWGLLLLPDRSGRLLESKGPRLGGGATVLPAQVPCTAPWPRLLICLCSVLGLLLPSSVPAVGSPPTTSSRPS